MRQIVVAIVLLAVFCAPAQADEKSGWYKTLKEGEKAAKQSGKPILYITGWKPKV